MDKLSVLVFLLCSDHIWGLRRSVQCGLPLSQGKIVGGVDSGGYRYPWFALLLLKKNSHIPVPVCAGSLISKFHVLTAAHCFTISASVQYQDLFTVALGVYDICSDSEGTRQIFDVEKVAVHEKYQKSGKFYDIALIKLNRPAEFTFICLPLFGVPDITEVAVVIGFGVTGENSNLVPCHMLEVNVTKYSKKDCSNSKLPQEDKEEPSVFCAGSFTGQVDSCYGDSGGPLQTKKFDGRYVIEGIVSYGYGCGVKKTPGVYTNVGSYVQWINSNMLDLDSKESNSTKKEYKSGLINRKPNSFRRRANSDVTFPEGKNLSFNIDERKSPTSTGSTGYSERKRPTFDNSNFYITKKDQKNAHTRNSERNTVTFPE